MNILWRTRNLHPARALIYTHSNAAWIVNIKREIFEPLHKKPPPPNIPLNGVITSQKGCRFEIQLDAICISSPNENLMDFSIDLFSFWECIRSKNEQKLETSSKSYDMRIIFRYTWGFYTFMCFMRSIKFSICAWHFRSVYLCKKMKQWKYSRCGNKVDFSALIKTEKYI